VVSWFKDPLGMKAYAARSASGWQIVREAKVTVGPAVPASAWGKWQGFRR
jgi:hypothetical protein